MAGKAVPNKTNPAYVWEIELTDPLPRGLELLDPVKEVADHVPLPTASLTYAHDGPQTFLLGLIDPTHKNHLLDPTPMPPGSSFQKAPNLTPELQTLVFALRDAEILAIGTIPAVCVRARYELF